MNGLCGLDTGIYPGPVCFKPDDHHGMKTASWVFLNKEGKIEILRKYWSGERFDYDGKIFKLEDVDMLPRPVNGTIPIWGSGRQDAPMKRAALLCDGWHPYMYTPERCRESFLQVKRYAEEAGRVLPKDYVLACFIYTALFDDLETARKHASKFRDAGYGYLVCGWPGGGDAQVEAFARDVMPEFT